MEKISVIVAVYNVENYILKCLNSIKNQSYKNLEIIIINDGSSDNSLEICNSFISQNSNLNLKLFNQHNKGLSEARNIGFENSTGMYISFIDGDDFINENFFSILYNDLIKNNVDISICNYKKIYSDCQDSSNSKNLKGSILTKTKYIEKVLYNQVYTSAWGKLYKKSAIQDIKFIPRKFFEDMFYTCEWLKKSNNITFNATQLYYYNQIGTSITRSQYDKKKILDYYEAVKCWIDFFSSTEPRLKNKIYEFQITQYLNINSLYKKYINNEFNNNYWPFENLSFKNLFKYLINKNLGIKIKLKILFIKINGKKI